MTDEHLLDQAAIEFENKRKANLAKRAEQAKQKQERQEKEQQQQAVVNAAAGNQHKNGFIVLGMHRSGTSMVSGLLHQSGYNVGGVSSVKCYYCCYNLTETIELTTSYTLLLSVITATYW